MHGKIGRIGANRTPENVNLLKLAALPLLIWFVSGDAGRMVAGALIFAVIWVAGHFLIQGIRAQNGESLDDVANWPRKMIGSGLMAVALLMLGLMKFDSALMAVAIGFVGFGLCLLAFGLDEYSPNARPRARTLSAGEEAKFIETADRVLNAIVRRIETLDEDDLTTHAVAFREVFMDTVENNPAVQEELLEDIRNTITQAAMATDTFYIDYQENPDPDFKRRYIRALGDLAEEMVATFREATARDEGDDSRNDKLFDQMTRRSVA
ncbi:hypothetical protein [Pseudoprimorskyibacter insulae]|nr:hypothetical protein [Pseudoprimorskyibacter insulae]